MKLYSLFLLVASVTVLSPGPGVIMSLTNALRYGLRGTFGGILGIAVGALVVAIRCTYALFARQSRHALSSERGGSALNRAASATLVLFGATLAMAHR